MLKATLVESKSSRAKGKKQYPYAANYHLSRVADFGTCRLKVEKILKEPSELTLLTSLCSYYNDMHNARVLIQSGHAEAWMGATMKFARLDAKIIIQRAGGPQISAAPSHPTIGSGGPHLRFSVLLSYRLYRDLSRQDGEIRHGPCR